MPFFLCAPETAISMSPVLCLHLCWFAHKLQAKGRNRKHPDYSISTGDCIIVSFAETQNVSFPSICALRWWAHWKYLMFIKILSSFSVDSLWEGSDQVSKCPSSLLTDRSCVCLFVTLTFVLCCLTNRRRIHEPTGCQEICRLIHQLFKMPQQMHALMNSESSHRI